jgi:trk system potassium uptake protein TrkH
MRVTGLLLLVMACSMVLPIAASVYYGDGAQFDLILSAVGILLVGLLFRNILGNDPNYVISERESFWVTSIIWIVIPLIGALPYMLTGYLTHVTDAIFESMSGFTTTGSSMLIGRLDKVPKGLLVWRSMTQWIGGLGLILFVIAVLKKLNVGSVQLYDTEFSGTVQRKLHPHIATSVSFMWRIYILGTLLLFALLMLAGNGLFESFCVTLSTVSTGGFTVTEAGLTQFNNLSLFFITIFMFLAGVNIALVYYLITGKGRNMWHDQEFRLYLTVFVCVTIFSIIAFVLKGNPIGQSINYAFFHTASTMSTTGFGVTRPSHWPTVLSILTFLLILVGASAGSTGGGIKWKRIMVVGQYVRNYLIHTLHPNAVRTVKINHFVISTDYINKIFAFVFLYIFFLLGGAFLLTICGLDIPSAFTVAAANISNLGPSPLINELGTTINYVALPLLGKWTLIVLMMLGRIEIFAILAIFSSAYWKRG